ncbi:serum paraoxonase/arylesterase [Pleurotus eryngii]|uniref:Serum paraoxonase/arylesterase n=1 Tax=Pleurotus eryngii TaxID=5323 RepID=A0A9P6DCR9_PLEER|nr:serum paraoxonase/arylesterase [Pleurotus eryngii]
MPPTIVVALTSFFALLGAVYVGWWQPIFTKLGDGREVRPVGNTGDCTTEPALKACEKIVLHQPSGSLYLACSTPESRTHWTPAVGRLNSTGMSTTDYVAIYDPDTSKITRLNVVGFTSERGLSLHGMDVVPSSSDPKKLFVYLVNHRAPLTGVSEKVGADSSVEIFSTVLGGSTMTHVKTVEDPAIITPNDVVGYPDGKSFYFTNDHGAKTGILRDVEILGLKRTSVGYCDIDSGCTIVRSSMHANNGIAGARNNDTLYVANSIAGGITVLETQADHSVVLADFIPTEYPIDNVSVDEAGHVWAAAFPKALTTALVHFSFPSVAAPSAAYRVSLNTGTNAFYGEKYKVDRVFEDDGSLASGITSVVHDSQRHRLFLNGLASPSLVICKS